MSVQITEEQLTLPTYREPEPEAMPMYAENRVHQRTSGRPYPNRVVLNTDRQHKSDRAYQAVRLENKFLSIIILPELGGRIYSATDKTTGYDFFYRQHVIKPALIGVLGSWVSGGVEFNWPFHHRPSTFMPTDYAIEHEDDGAVTVWLSEHDPIERMKGMVGIRLRPDEAIFETRMVLSNRTPIARSFLWWENAAVPVNKDYQIFFPTDVTYVNFHYHRSVTTWPKASGVFNGIRLGEKVDIRRHENTKSPTSYFSAASQYDFFGGYDHGKACGVVHIGNHHVSTGKKLFTWAYNQLSESWENALTDEDGAYAELMAGSYSDNQPDFAWLEPFETKKFSQFWYPISKIGAPVCANTNLAINLEHAETATTLTLQSVRTYRGASIRVSAEGKSLLETTADLAATDLKTLEIPAHEGSLLVTIFDNAGRPLLRYAEPVVAAESCADTMPEPWVDLPPPSHFKTAQECHLAGVHIEQYRDPKSLPDAYWETALRLDPHYAPALIDLGHFHYKRADYAQARTLFEHARKVLTRHNSNPRSGEVFYALGLVYLAQGVTDAAYDAFYKASWNEAHISRSMTLIAMINGQRGNWEQMLEHAERALAHEANNPLAGALAAAAEQKMGDTKAAVSRLDSILCSDPLNHFARYLRIRFSDTPISEFYGELYSSPAQTCLDLAYDLAKSGLLDEAIELLKNLPASATTDAPMVPYTQAAFALDQGDETAAKAFITQAEATAACATFPWRHEELAVLRIALAFNDKLPQAWSRLGNLLYDKRHFEEAAQCWDRSLKLQPKNPTILRNLAIASYSHLKRWEEVLPLLKQALELAPTDEQLVYETAHVMSKLGVNPAERVDFLQSKLEEIKQYLTTPRPLRDDLVLEFVRALNHADRSEDALQVLAGHTFVPCEGGEHVVATQHMFAHHNLGRQALRAGDAQTALEHFRQAQVLPQNLGAGLWNEVMLVPHQYYEALCLEQLGQDDEARKIYQHFLVLTVDYFSNMHLPALPVYQAIALDKTGRATRARQQLRAALTKWTEAMQQEVAGNFKTTPFFISYIDDPVQAQAAYFRYLTGLARRALGDMQGALSDFQASLQADPSDLYCWIEAQSLEAATL